MLEYPTKKEAAEAIGLDPRTVYRWPDAIDEAIEFLISDAIQSAHDILEQSVVKAAQIKRAGLDSDDEKLRQGVSSEILDRMLGRATQRQEISGPEGGPIELDSKYQQALDTVYGEGDG
jgi:hypothetical protein